MNAILTGGRDITVSFKCLLNVILQRDRMEREVGGGTGMGNTCKSMANSFQCMTKTTAML